MAKNSSSSGCLIVFAGVIVLSIVYYVLKGIAYVLNVIANFFTNYYKEIFVTIVSIALIFVIFYFVLPFIKSCRMLKWYKQNKELLSFLYTNSYKSSEVPTSQLPFVLTNKFIISNSLEKIMDTVDKYDLSKRYRDITLVFLYKKLIKCNYLHNRIHNSEKFNFSLFKPASAYTIFSDFIKSRSHTMKFANFDEREQAELEHTSILEAVTVFYLYTYLKRSYKISSMILDYIKNSIAYRDFEIKDKNQIINEYKEDECTITHYIEKRNNAFIYYFIIELPESFSKDRVLLKGTDIIFNEAVGELISLEGFTIASRSTVVNDTTIKSSEYILSNMYDSIMLSPQINAKIKEYLVSQKETIKGLIKGKLKNNLSM